MPLSLLNHISTPSGPVSNYQSSNSGPSGPVSRCTLFLISTPRAQRSLPLWTTIEIITSMATWARVPN